MEFVSTTSYCPLGPRCTESRAGSSSPDGNRLSSGLGLDKSLGMKRLGPFITGIANILVIRPTHEVPADPAHADLEALHGDLKAVSGDFWVVLEQLKRENATNRELPSR